jgi:hypothetical protein
MRNEYGKSHSSESAPNLRRFKRSKPAARLLPVKKQSRAPLAKTPNVDELQRWVQEVTSHPGGVDAGIDSDAAKQLIPIDSANLEKVILPSKNLSSHERIGIYADMYFLRLVDCMAGDFDGCVYALGRDRFDELARAYITAHPSTNYSLNVFSRHFSAFLLNEVPDLLNREFLSDLARLEWAVQEIFEEKNVTPVTVDQLLAVPPATWENARIKFIPALRLQEFSFPVNRFLQAVYNESEPGLPARRKTWLRVYRRGFRVWRASVDRNQFKLLSALVSGKTLSDALDDYVRKAGESEPEAAAAVGEWFKEWAADGMIHAIE